MAADNSLLVPASQRERSDPSTQSTQDTYDPLISRVPGQEPRHPSSLTSSIAYEPSHVESYPQEEESIPLSPVPLHTTLASWCLEIGAMILSIGSIVAIVTVLHQQNDRSLDRWSLEVSLNTVISALGTLARTTLAFALSACVGQQKWSWLHKRSDRIVAFERFDEAAKGPWGGTRLFIWLRARHWAALGALVIMGTIAFDPFLQAVVSLEGRMDDIAQGANATIRYASNIYGGVYTRESNLPSTSRNSTLGGASFMKVVFRPDFGVVGSTYSGLRNPSEPLVEPTSFTCVTGNCTWPVFSSAAVCSSCVDISAGLEQSAEFGTYGVSIPWDSGSTYKSDYTVWSVGSANIRNYNARYNPGNTTHPQTRLVLNTTWEPIKTTAHQDLKTMLMSFTTIRASEDFLTKNSMWNESRPVATECALFLCANAYQALTVNNALEEQLIGTWSQKEPQSYALDYTKYIDPPDQEYIDQRLSSLGNTLWDGMEDHHDLQVIIPSDALNASDTIQRSFNISQGFIQSTISFLDDFTTNPASENAASDSGWRGSRNVGYPSNTYQMPIIVDALWNSTNLATTFDNVARSITSQLRNTSPTRHEGSLQRWTIHVRVKWLYLLFPITMLATGLLYVILVIIESTRLRLPVWKESAVPTLLYGFSDETQRLLREERHSKKTPATTVRYRVDEKGDYLRLVADQKA